MNNLLITKLVDQILDMTKNRKPPIDVFGISEEFCIDVKFEDLDEEVSGFLLVKNKKSTIVVNSLHHANRQRFTIAHELGHYFLHVDHKLNAEKLFVDEQIYHRRDVALKQITSKQHHKVEKEANKFAATLLMPKKLLQQALDEEDYDLSDDLDVQFFAKKFGVSEQALGYRIGDLRLII